MNFRDKVIVVTGAGAGIGKGIAEEFAKEGARIAVLEINAETGAKAAEELREQGTDAVFIQTDVSSNDSVKSAVEQVAAQWGVIDALINNAGIAVWKGVKELTSEDWDRVMGVNLKSVFLLSKYSIPFMKDSSVKSIVNISSVHAENTIANYDAYVTAKGGIQSLTRSMSLTLQEDRIRVNGVCPGFIDTEMFQKFLESLDDPEAYLKYILAFHTRGRIGTPKDIGRVCIFLCSPDADFINGQLITVDGGVSFQLKH